MKVLFDFYDNNLQYVIHTKFLAKSDEHHCFFKFINQILLISENLQEPFHRFTCKNFALRAICCHQQQQQKMTRMFHVSVILLGLVTGCLHKLEKQTTWQTFIRGY